MPDIFQHLSEIEFNKAAVIQPRRLSNFSLLSNGNIQSPFALRHAIDAAQASGEREPSPNQAFSFPSPLVSAENQHLNPSIPSLHQMSLAQPAHLVHKALEVAGEGQLAESLNIQTGSEDALAAEEGRSLSDLATSAATMKTVAAQSAANPAGESLQLASAHPSLTSLNQEMTSGVIQRQSEMGITTHQADRQSTLRKMTMPMVAQIQPLVMAATDARQPAVEADTTPIAKPDGEVSLNEPSAERVVTAGDQMTTIEPPPISQKLEARISAEALDSTLHRNPPSASAIVPSQPIVAFAEVSPTLDKQMTTIETLNALPLPSIESFVTPGVVSLVDEKTSHAERVSATVPYPADIISTSPTLASLVDNNIAHLARDPSPESKMPLLDVPTATTRPNHEPRVTSLVEPTVSNVSQAIQPNRADVARSTTGAMIPSIAQKEADTHQEADTHRVRRKPSTTISSNQLERLPSSGEQTVSPVGNSATIEPQHPLTVTPEIVEDTGARSTGKIPQTSRESDAPSNRQRLVENSSLIELKAQPISSPSSLHKGTVPASYTSETQVVPLRSFPLQQVSPSVEQTDWMDRGEAGNYLLESVALEATPVKPSFAERNGQPLLAPMDEQGVTGEITKALSSQSESVSPRRPEWVAELIGGVEPGRLSQSLENSVRPASLSSENVTAMAPTIQAISSADSDSGMQSVTQRIRRLDGEPQVHPLASRWVEQSLPFEEALQPIGGSLYDRSAHVESPRSEITTQSAEASPTDIIRLENAPSLRLRAEHPVRPVRSVDLVILAQKDNKAIASNSVAAEQESMELAPMSSSATQLANASIRTTGIHPQVGISAPVRKQQPAVEPQPMPTIRVTIGRVIVQTRTESPQTAAPQRRPVQPALSLDAYLQQRQREAP